jgi:hypothetical protein
MMPDGDAAKKIVRCTIQAGEPDNLQPLALHPVEVGTRAKIRLLVQYSNDPNRYPANNVTWTLPTNVVFISDYNPQTQFAQPIPVFGGFQNPISLVPWFAVGPFQPGITILATIAAAGIDPRYGLPVNAVDYLPVTTPNVQGEYDPQTGQEIYIDMMITPPTLKYGLYFLNLEITQSPAGAQFILVQLVNTLRRFLSSQGRHWDQSNSGGTFWCDYPASQGVFYCEYELSTGAEFEFEGFDTPSNRFTSLRSPAKRKCSFLQKRSKCSSFIALVTCLPTNTTQTTYGHRF